jgi:DNA-binding LytR/AlgR family response regulator
MPTVLIADDEPRLADELARRLVSFWPGVSISAICNNGIDAARELIGLQPDFCFLDIHMPGLTGIQVARSASRSRVVFVTAYDEYALAAFNAAAVDYLLKPVSDERLLQCIHRLQQTGSALVDLSAIAHKLARETPAMLSWIKVGLGDTVQLVAAEDVLFFHSADKYTEVHTSDATHLIRTPLKELLPQLDPRKFSQIRRGCIINLAAIQRIESNLLGRQRVHVKGRKDVITVGRAYAAQFKHM